MAKMIKNLIKKCCDFFKSASKWIYLRQNKVFLNPHLGGFGYPNSVDYTPILAELKKHWCVSCNEYKKNSPLAPEILILLIFGVFTDILPIKKSF